MKSFMQIIPNFKCCRNVKQVVCDFINNKVKDLRYYHVVKASLSFIQQIINIWSSDVVINKPNHVLSYKSLEHRSTPGIVIRSHKWMRKGGLANITTFPLINTLRGFYLE